MIDNEQPVKTVYCNSACQKTDWALHKKRCKRLSARKQLYRAGDLVQRIFYVYWEQAYEKLIIKVEKDRDKLYLYEGQYGSKVLVPFPHHLFASEEASCFDILRLHGCSGLHARNRENPLGG